MNAPMNRECWSVLMTKSCVGEGNRVARVAGAKAVHRTLTSNTYGHKIVRLKDQVS